MKTSVWNPLGVRSESSHPRDGTGRDGTGLLTERSRSSSFGMPRQPNTPRVREGARRLAQFNSAPESVKAAFEAVVVAQVEAERDFARWLAEVESDDPVPPAFPVRLPRHEARWDDTWQRRARVARVLRANPKAGGLGPGEYEAMVGLDLREAWPKLTGEDVPPHGRVSCPFPAHEDTHPACHVYEGDRGWFCHVCGKGGTVYELAAALWDMPLRGPEFVELHNRIKAVLA